MAQVFFTCGHNRAPGPIYAPLGLLYLHLPINSILPGSSCGPLSGPTDLACAQLAIFCHLPTPLSLGLCNKSSKGKKIPLNTGHTGFSTRFLIEEIAFYTAPALSPFFVIPATSPFLPFPQKRKSIGFLASGCLPSREGREGQSGHGRGTSAAAGAPPTLLRHTLYPMCIKSSISSAAIGMVAVKSSKPSSRITTLFSSRMPSPSSRM